MSSDMTNDPSNPPSDGPKKPRRGGGQPGNDNAAVVRNKAKAKAKAEKEYRRSKRESAAIVRGDLSALNRRKARRLAQIELHIYTLTRLIETLGKMKSRHELSRIYERLLNLVEQDLVELNRFERPDVPRGESTLTDLILRSMGEDAESHPPHADPPPAGDRTRRTEGRF